MRFYGRPSPAGSCANFFLEQCPEPLRDDAGDQRGDKTEYPFHRIRVALLALLVGDVGSLYAFAQHFQILAHEGQSEGCGWCIKKRVFKSLHALVDIVLPGAQIGDIRPKRNAFGD